MTEGEKHMNQKPSCPRCGEAMQIFARGIELRLWSCNSVQCKKEPFGFSIYFQPNQKIPVCWSIEYGKLHQLTFQENLEQPKKERKEQ